ncbi:DNA repair protein RecN [Corynebacterium yudongzhengii]|uniref:DNA repair protein RecN n=1 Tax=Corynebacterium yudongzhengii TaxID=2080740 RepID=A0A2U1T8N5_9CORY|nr:DNA repair protein RecN [Corynebacterium yudongzhengii]AWB82984.1 DNA repair protein RecN [Corynebacterium yudongzhengii]PWC02374.1 DNA repair protein RecN [Corynebacterium yudongzhengii]
MLADISIDNLGVISQASAELSDGLTVLTGETGAGKTMVVTGLRLLTGGRADASRVRAGADKAGVDGHFDLSGIDDATRERLLEQLESAGGAADGEEVTASRTVNASGRSRAHLGGRSVPAATLKEFTAPLLTIHGQNDQLRLLAPEQQLDALDRFDSSIAPLKNDYQRAYQRWRSLAKDLKQRTASRRELAREADQLNFALSEIDEIDPSPGEDVVLVEQIRRLQDVDTLRDAAATALTSIDGPEAMGGYGDDDPASGLIGRAEEALAGSGDERLQALGAELAEITGRLSTITGELGSYLADLDADPDKLDQLLTRQQDLKGLIRKYGADIDAVIAYRDAARKRYASIDTSNEALEELAREVRAAEKEMRTHARALTAARTAAAAQLGEQVTEEIRGLAMPKARLHVNVSPTDPGPQGADQVELQLAPNDATEPRPLASAASGGELSRVMLGLEVILAADTRGATMVFDEVDAGVGGRAAVEIGRRLARLASNNQVLVVTHLPQVAAYADTHLHVAKNVGDTDVTSGVLTLDDEARVEELARMLAGLDDTETGRAHAAELRRHAVAEVRELRGA